MTTTPERECRHCGRAITKEAGTSGYAMWRHLDGYASCDKGFGIWYARPRRLPRIFRKTTG